MRSPDMKDNAIKPARHLLPGALMTTLAVVALAACSTSGGTTTRTTHPRPSSVSPATKHTTSAPPTAGALTGTWSGQYSGSYTGTFKLHWRQAGSKLNGTITISNPPSRLPIHGTVNGDSISFGTVGGAAITYSGTVSGNSMSGTYQVNGQGGGPWSASKS